MKKLILLLMLGFASAIANTSQAQVSINVNIGSQPAWSPVYYEEVSYRPVVTRYYAPAPRYVAVRNYAPVRRYVPVRNYYRTVPRHHHQTRYAKQDKHRGYGKGHKHGHGGH